MSHPGNGLDDLDISYKNFQIAKALLFFGSFPVGAFIGALIGVFFGFPGLGALLGLILLPLLLIAVDTDQPSREQKSVILTNSNSNEGSSHTTLNSLGLGKTHKESPKSDTREELSSATTAIFTDKNQSNIVEEGEGFPADPKAKMCDRRTF